MTEVAPRRRRWPRTLIVVLVVLAVLLIAARLALPFVLKREINRRLQEIPGYTGSVDAVAVHLWDGGYRMDRFVIEKRGAHNEPFIAARSIDFSIAYRRLLHGQFVSDIAVDRGQINFVNSPAPEERQDLGKAAEAPAAAPAPDQRWQDVVHDLFPIDITRLQLTNSRIHYIDTTHQPRIDLAVDQLELEADGLRNRPEANHPALPAQITLRGETIGRGEIALVLALEPLALKPHFQLKLTLRDLALPSLNEFMLAYAGVDVSKGTFQLYAEVNGDAGDFHGYVKPVLTDLHWKTQSDAEKNPLQRLWKSLVAATTRLLRDKQEKQVATIIPFSGKFEQGSNVRIWTTVGNLFHNGFIEALRRGLEGSANATKEGAAATGNQPIHGPGENPS